MTDNEVINLLLFAPLEFSLFNINGQMIRQKQAGNVNEFTFRAEDLSPGIYLYTLSSNGMKVGTGKLVVMK